ncbi:hypothetical protein RISK_004280 [Rhodopirellula islandica]|uniref:Uncharacterized protein n=1 Tax=Rhodopirellula islandica TaxID=595434 RepID=A0A0J1BBG0_RHOIS|nr:hypothetical protein RISK_004280 [Rhodopirellula islandica]
MLRSSRFETRTPSRSSSAYDGPVRGDLLGSAIGLGASAPSEGRQPHPGQTEHKTQEHKVPASFPETRARARAQSRQRRCS